jgi:hypothetical protein
MKRDGFDKIVSEAVSHALGMQLDVIGQGRVSDGRYCFARTHKSRCHVCSVPFLKEHVDSEQDIPCEAEDRLYCRTRRLAQGIAAFGSARAVEDRIEAALRGMGISSEVSLGRGSAHNMSILIKIDDVGRTRLKELKIVAKRARDQQRLATTLGQALDILSPAGSQ